MSFPKSENAESDLQKATSEVILLREEESKLRHENLQLKVSLACSFVFYCFIFSLNVIGKLLLLYLSKRNVALRTFFGVLSILARVVATGYE